ncbi:MAG: hypothetical protein Q8Q04_02550 [archaeon]|nr:hypothetical protein [archaeon]
MRKGAVIFAFLFLISIFLMALAYADEIEQVENAYQCLENVVGNKTCASLPIEEKIFSILSIGECKDELINDAIKDGGECWPKLKGGSSCDIETTAKAVLALDSVDKNATVQKEWLLSQVGVSSDLNWFLEIDNSGSSGALSCSVWVKDPDSVSYPRYDFEIGEDKKIGSDAGPCLTRANNNYWFKISPECYDRSFQTKCDEGFLTTLVYQEKNSQTYHISDEVHSVGRGGDTIEKVNSYCFLNGGSCDYLGSLWATLVLDSLGEPVSKFLPYLTALAPSYPEAFPSPFLYILTSKLEYKTTLLNNQKHIFDEYYWEIPGGRGKYYDTALALLPFQGDTLEEKENSKSWLLGVQGAQGCWDNKNIVSTGFVLYSIWPRNNGGIGEISCSEMGFSCINSGDSCSGILREQFTCGGSQVCCDPVPDDEDVTCSEEGNTCVEDENSCSGEVTGGLCAGNDVCCDLGGGEETECEIAGFSCGWSDECTGSLLSQYECTGIKKCCDTDLTQTFCSDVGGEICSNTEFCSGGNVLETDDLDYGEECCLEPGECKLEATNLDCESNLGYCSSSTSCDSGYEETSEFSCSNSEVCCVQSQSSGGEGSYWWIWALFFLVILVVVAILYRDKIKEMLDKMRARRSGRSGPAPGRGMPPRGMPPRFPPDYSREPRMGSPVPRKIVPPENPRPIQKPIPKKSSKEIDEVLKKLKEIGK